MSINPRRNRWIRTSTAVMACLVVASGLVGPVGHAQAASECGCPACCPSGATPQVTMFGSGPATHSALTSMPTLLNMGTRGPAVADLQRALMSAGLTVRGGADGIFGQATQAAVRTFQLNKGLPPTGTADGHTLFALGLLTTRVVAASPTATAVRGRSGDPTTLPPPAPRPPAPEGDASTSVTISLGSRGDLVVRVQQALIAAGIRVAGGADGVFGSATRNAVRTFQSQQGLPVTGTVDTATFRLLTGEGATTPSTPPPAPTNDPQAIVLRSGARGDDVKRLQEALMWSGVNLTGGADGVYGSATQRAVREFQTNRGLNVSGNVDRTTWEALNLHLPNGAGRVVLEVFPMQGPCFFIDTWGAARSGGRRHEGVDIIGATGRELYAVVSGTITRVYNDRPGTLTGNGLRLTAPDGTYFFYAHLSAFAEGITVGSEVTAGQVIGYNGATGNAGGPHLHFEIHPGGGAAINPYPMVKALDGCSENR